MSTIFEFTHEISDDFYQLAMEIENLLYEQPNSILMKSRLYCEQLVKMISEQEEIEEVYPLKNAERIYKLYRTEAIEEEIYLKLEWIRKMGNKAAHDLNAIDIQGAIKAHRFLFDISVWYMEVYVSYDFVAPIYQLPKRKATVTPDADQLLKPYVDKTMKKIDSLWEEVNEKLENIKKEKEQAELNINQNTTEIEKIPFPILAYLQEQDLEYIDKRDKNGALWIIGDWSINIKLNPLKKYKIYFRFTKKGGKSTGYKPAWFLLNKSLPLVEARDIGLKSNATVKTSNTYKEKEEVNLFTIAPLTLDYWIDKGQIRFPRHLEHVTIPGASSKGIVYLKEHWDITLFSEITENILREVYIQSRSHFFHITEELYVLGFRFTGKLAAFQNGPTIEKDSQIQVNDFSREMESLFSLQLRKRLDMYQINSIKDLDKKLLSTLSWILKEDIDQVKSYFEGLNKGNATSFSESYIQEKSAEETLYNTENKQSENQQITLYLGQEMLTVSESLSSQPLEDLGIFGTDNMLARLIENEMHCLRDMPTYLDGIHRQLKGVGERTVFKFWEELKGLKKIEAPTQTVEDGELVIHFEQNHFAIPKEVKNMEMEPKFFPANVSSTLEALKEGGILKFSDLPVDLLQLELPGIGKVRIRNLYHSLKRAVKLTLEEQKLKQLSHEELLKYELERYSKWYERVKVSTEERKKFKIPPQYLELVQKRYSAFLEDEHLTLEQLGNEQGVTRERIRQILKKGDTILLDNWERLSSLLTQRISGDNEIILAKELDNALEPDFLLIHGLEGNGIYYHQLNSIPLLTVKNKRQLNEYFDKLRQDVKKVFSKLVITIADLNEFCKERSLEDGSPYEVIQEVVSAEINWLSEGQGIIRSMTKADIVEMVMLQYPQGVEIYQREAELIEKGNDLMPGGFNWERSFNSIVGREGLQDIIYMWGRGTYIHSNFVSVDEKWIDSLINMADSWLENEEFFHIGKLYDVVKNEAMEQGVPNEYALYSLIRLSSQQKLSLPRFPSVLPYGVDRLENHEWMVKFMKEKDRPVSVGELVEEFVVNKGWKRFTLEINLSKSTEIIPYKHAFYTLASKYKDLDEEELQFIISKLKMVLNEKQFIYFPSFFKENEMYLKSIGIPTAYVLYGLLRKRELTTVNFPHFPYAVSDEFEGDSVAITDIVEGLIQEENRIVAREEVRFWIDELLGGGNRILDLVLIRSENLLYYSRGQYGEYVHRDTIQMDAENVEKILELISVDFNEIRRNLARDYVYISELFNPQRLPKLPESIQWSEELLVDILKKSGKWKIFGSYYALLSPSDGGIPDETAFIEVVLQQQFDGAVKLTDIRRFLRDKKYSKDGYFLSEVNEAIENKEAPFTIEGDELIHNSLVEGSILG